MDKSDISFEEYYKDVLCFLRGLSRDEYLAEELTQETICRWGLMRGRIIRTRSRCWRNKACAQVCLFDKWWSNVA